LKYFKMFPATRTLILIDGHTTTPYYAKSIVFNIMPNPC
jgi:hypothetical protein